MRFSRLLLTMLLATLVISPLAAQNVDDDITILRTDEPISAWEMSVRMSEQTNPTGGETPIVVLASASSFADALSSSGLQAQGPLLLVPDELPLPGRVHAELKRLDPGRVILMGGPAAIPAEVEAELQRLGFATERRQGPTRIETALAVALTDYPDTETAILVRGYAADDGDPTQAWADSVTAGALSVQLGAPVLLTHRDQLTGPTADYFRANPQISGVAVVGGPAAVSEDVRRTLANEGIETLRVAGDTRFGTAIRLAAERSVPPGARAIVFDGTSPDGWQAGLVAARQAGLFSAALLPLDGTSIPASIAQYLQELSPTALTCIVGRTVCNQVRDAAREPGRPLITYDPPSGSAVNPGDPLVLQVDDPQRLLSGDVTLSTDCVATRVEYLPEGRTVFALAVSPPEELGGGDQQPTEAPEPTPLPTASPSPSPSPSASPQPTATPSGGAGGGTPVNEPAPADAPPTTCTVTVEAPRTDGGTLVDLAHFHVIDLRPRIRVASFPQVAGQPISLQDRSDGLITAWSWDFGDGSPTSTERNPTHTWQDASCYDVALTVSTTLRHPDTGEPFTDTEVRTVDVAPADPGVSAMGVLVVRDTDGERLTGIEVELQRIRNGQPVTVVTETSGPDGRVRFPNLLPGTYIAEFTNDPSVAAHAPYESNTNPLVLQVTLEGGDIACPTLRLLQPGTLVVRLVDGETQQTLTDGRVEIYDGMDQLVASGEVDDSGRFSAELTTLDVYDIRAMVDGYDDALVEDVAVEQAVDTLQDVTMTRVQPTPTPTATSTAGP